MAGRQAPAEGLPACIHQGGPLEAYCKGKTSPIEEHASQSQKVEQGVLVVRVRWGFYLESLGLALTAGTMTDVLAAATRAPAHALSKPAGDSKQTCVKGN